MKQIFNIQNIENINIRNIFSAMTRLTSEQGGLLRARLVGDGDYSSLPPAGQDCANNINQDFTSLQSEPHQAGRGKMMILTKDLVTISARDNNNNGSGPLHKW